MGPLLPRLGGAVRTEWTLFPRKIWLVLSCAGDPPVPPPSPRAARRRLLCALRSVHGPCRTTDKPGQSAFEAAWRERFPDEPFHLVKIAPENAVRRAPPNSPPLAFRLSPFAAFRSAAVADSPFPAPPRPAWQDAAPPPTAPAKEPANKLSVDLAAVAERQSDVLYQVSLPQYSDPAFLSAACERYFKMLVLMRENPGAFVVPTLDMDLLWHTHLAFPAAYAQDTRRIVGSVVAHDDSVNDRAEGSKLSVSSQTTAELWERQFGEPWARPGCMYRGKTPEAFMRQWATGGPVTEGAGAAGYPGPPQGYPAYGPPAGAFAPPPPGYGAPPPGYGAPQYYPPPGAQMQAGVREPRRRPQSRAPLSSFTFYSCA